MMSAVDVPLSRPTSRGAVSVSSTPSLHTNANRTLARDFSATTIGEEDKNGSTRFGSGILGLHSVTRGPRVSSVHEDDSRTSAMARQSRHDGTASSISSRSGAAGGRGLTAVGAQHAQHTTRSASLNTSRGRQFYDDDDNGSDQSTDDGDGRIQAGTATATAAASVPAASSRVRNENAQPTGVLASHTVSDEPDGRIAPQPLRRAKSLASSLGSRRREFFEENDDDDKGVHDEVNSAVQRGELPNHIKEDEREPAATATAAADRYRASLNERSSARGTHQRAPQLHPLPSRSEAPFRAKLGQHSTPFTAPKADPFVPAAAAPATRSDGFLRDRMNAVAPRFRGQRVFCHISGGDGDGCVGGRGLSVVGGRTDVEAEPVLPLEVVLEEQWRSTAAQEVAWWRRQCAQMVAAQMDTRTRPDLVAASLHARDAAASHEVDEGRQKQPTANLDSHRAQAGQSETTAATSVPDENAPPKSERTDAASSAAPSSHPLEPPARRPCTSVTESSTAVDENWGRTSPQLSRPPALPTSITYEQPQLQTVVPSVSLTTAQAEQETQQCQYNTTKPSPLPREPRALSATAAEADTTRRGASVEEGQSRATSLSPFSPPNPYCMMEDDSAEKACAQRAEATPCFRRAENREPLGSLMVTANGEEAEEEVRHALVPRYAHPAVQAAATAVAASQEEKDGSDDSAIVSVDALKGTPMTTDMAGSASMTMTMAVASAPTEDVHHSVQAFSATVATDDPDALEFSEAAEDTPSRRTRLSGTLALSPSSPPATRSTVQRLDATVYTLTAQLQTAQNESSRLRADVRQLQLVNDDLDTRVLCKEEQLCAMRDELERVEAESAALVQQLRQELQDALQQRRISEVGGEQSRPGGTTTTTSTLETNHRLERAEQSTHDELQEAAATGDTRSLPPTRSECTAPALPSAGQPPESTGMSSVFQSVPQTDSVAVAEAVLESVLADLRSSAAAAEAAMTASNDTPHDETAVARKTALDEAAARVESALHRVQSSASVAMHTTEAAARRDSQAEHALRTERHLRQTAGLLAQLVRSMGSEVPSELNQQDKGEGLESSTQALNWQHVDQLLQLTQEAADTQALQVAELREELAVVRADRNELIGQQSEQVRELQRQLLEKEQQIQHWMEQMETMEAARQKSREASTHDTGASSTSAETALVRLSAAPTSAGVLVAPPSSSSAELYSSLSPTPHSAYVAALLHEKDETCVSLQMALREAQAAADAAQSTQRQLLEERIATLEGQLRQREEHAAEVYARSEAEVTRLQHELADTRHALQAKETALRIALRESLPRSPSHSPLHTSVAVSHETTAARRAAGHGHENSSFLSTRAPSAETEVEERTPIAEGIATVIDDASQHDDGFAMDDGSVLGCDAVVVVGGDATRSSPPAAETTAKEKKEPFAQEGGRTLLSLSSAASSQGFTHRTTSQSHSPPSSSSRSMGRAPTTATATTTTTSDARATPAAAMVPSASPDSPAGTSPQVELIDVTNDEESPEVIEKTLIQNGVARGHGNAAHSVSHGEGSPLRASSSSSASSSPAASPPSPLAHTRLSGLMARQSSSAAEAVDTSSSPLRMMPSRPAPAPSSTSSSPLQQQHQKQQQRPHHTLSEVGQHASPERKVFQSATRTAASRAHDNDGGDVATAARRDGWSGLVASSADSSPIPLTAPQLRGVSRLDAQKTNTDVTLSPPHPTSFSSLSSPSPRLSEGRGSDAGEGRTQRRRSRLAGRGALQRHREIWKQQEALLAELAAAAAAATSLTNSIGGGRVRGATRAANGEHSPFTTGALPFQATP